MHRESITVLIVFLLGITGIYFANIYIAKILATIFFTLFCARGLRVLHEQRMWTERESKNELL